MAMPSLFGLTSSTVKHLRSRFIGLPRFFHTSKTLRSQVDGNSSFDESMLKYLVCPLSKKQLRYDKEKNELVSETMNVAYPIINGIPNLVPRDGRILNENSSQNSDSKET